MGNSRQKITNGAETFLSYNTERFIDHSSVRPEWLPGDKFWYRTLTPTGSEFILVDPVKKTRSAAFDQEKLAASLTTAIGKPYQGNNLPFETFSFAGDNTSIHFRIGGKQWKCDLQNYQCTEDSEGKTGKSIRGTGSGRRQQRGNRGNEVLSPDGTKAAFIKDYNLWVRDIKTNQQTKLTTDGFKDFGYATDNAGWKSSDAAILQWSPDSKKNRYFSTRSTQCK